MSFWTYPDDRYYYRWYDETPRVPAPSDAEIKANIVDRLRVNPHTRPHDLLVDVKRGVVILRGQVSSRLAKRAAGDDSWDTPGVVDVSNQLEVAAGTDDDDDDTVDQVMSTNPITVGADESVAVAAARMRDAQIGSLPVTDLGGNLVGIVTDRDIVVRAVADGARATSVTVGDVCSSDLIALRPSDATPRAVQMMRDQAVRRLPVVEGHRLVGMVSLGDLARTRDPGSALADISAASPNL